MCRVRIRETDVGQAVFSGDVHYAAAAVVGEEFEAVSHLLHVALR